MARCAIALGPFDTIQPETFSAPRIRRSGAETPTVMATRAPATAEPALDAHHIMPAQFLGKALAVFACLLLLHGKSTVGR